MTAGAESSTPTSKLLRVLRDADWLTTERAHIFTRVWLTVSVIVTVALVLIAKNNLDPLGKPVGTDFASFWTASELALGGQPAKVYDIVAHHAAQTRLFGHDVGYYAFFYPPIFLWICLPLAGLPYLTSLGVWLAATGVAYVRVAREFLGRRGSWVAALAFPAVLINAGHGQNGFLSAALFGGGVLLLEGRPVLAGVLLGCLAYKPHLGLIIPVALLASGRWRSILGAACAALVLAGLSAGTFGLETWRAFLAALPVVRMSLEQNLVGNAKMQSTFAAVRLLHGSLGLAYGAQALVALGVCLGAHSLPAQGIPLQG